MALTRGARLGPFEITGSLGAGGMGEVYRARDTRLDREVALKILTEAFAHDADRAARFTREAKTLASLNHPHIAAIHGLEESQGVTALVMELVDGEDLSDRIARGALPLDETLSIARQIAEALEAAHDAGIVHRDLKPANIKLRPDGTVKVLDFGLAKALDQGLKTSRPQDLKTSRPQDLAAAPTITSPAMTAAGIILGTAAYMAPEQARGQAVDARADVWAFGCVLFEMLTGARAFRGDTVTDVLAAVVKEEPRWQDLPATIPAPLQRLLRRCLTKDRKRRLASAADARLEIDEAMDPRGPDAAAPAPGTPRPSPLHVLIATGAVVAAMAGAYFLGGRTVPVPATPAPVTRFVITAPPGTQIVSGHREVAISGDGRQIAFIARGAADQHVYVRRVDELASRHVAGTEGARDLAFSPDGRWIAFHAGNRIRKVNLAGGAPAVLADAAHSHGLVWHPAEDAIYFAPHQSSAIWKVAANGDSPAVQVTTLDAARGEISHQWPVLSSDGHTLVFTTNAVTAGPDEAEVSFLTLASQDRQIVRTGGGAFAVTEQGELLFVRRRSAMAAQYRDNRLSPPELLEAEVAIKDSNGTGIVTLSLTGTLAYVPSPDEKRRSLVWIAPDGKQSDAGFGQREFYAVSLSPDGRRAAVSLGDVPDVGLYLADAGGGPLTPLTQPAPGATAWSPDGKWIAGMVHFPNETDVALSRVAAETGRTWEKLLVWQDGLVTDWGPWTHDGRGLLFSRRDLQGSRSIALLGLDSTPAKVSVVLDRGEGRLVQYPAPSPDGRWLAYESNESGRAEVYVQSYPSPTVRVQVSRDGGTRPMWTNGGSVLYFVAGSTILSSTVTTHPTLGFGVPRVIVDDPLIVMGGAAERPLDVAPDGRILAIREDDSIRSDHIVVVQNWLSDVRARNADGRK